MTEGNRTRVVMGVVAKLPSSAIQMARNISYQEGSSFADDYPVSLTVLRRTPPSMD